MKQSKTNVTPCLHRTRAVQQNTVEVNIISDAVYAGCCTVRHDKSPTETCYRSFYLWSAETNFKSFSKVTWSRPVWADFSCCSASGVDTVLLTYREEPKQPQHPITGLPLLEFSPALESWSDPIFTRVLLLALSFCRRFPRNSSFPSFCRLARLFTEHSLLHIMSTHAPYCWLATSLFWYSAPTQFSKAFKKKYLPHLSQVRQFYRQKDKLNKYA